MVPVLPIRALAPAPFSERKIGPKCGGSGPVPVTGALWDRARSTVHREGQKPSMSSVVPVIGGIEEIFDLIDSLISVMVANINERLRVL